MVRRWSGRLAENAALSPGIVAEIVERTDGVPLFVEELTKAVLESANRENRVAALLAVASPIALSVPATLHASLMARLDRLGSAAREAAQIGAVLGREFTYELIELVARHPEKELQGALRRLDDAGLLFRRGTTPHSTYQFKHALVQDAALLDPVARAEAGFARARRGSARGTFRRSHRASAGTARPSYDLCQRC